MAAYRDACIQGLFHFDEATGLFVNRGIFGGTLTPIGSGHARSAASKFGANCYQAPATGSAGYTSTAVPRVVGTGPFMLSAWLYLTAHPGSGVRRIVGIGQPSVPKPALEMNPTGTVRLLQHSGGNISTALEGTAPVPLNQWVHIEAHRDGNSITRLLVDGVVQASSTTVVDATTSIVGNIDIGTANGTPAATLNNCRIDEVIYMVGLTDHEGAFTPETAAYADPAAPTGAGILPAAGIQLFPTSYPPRIVGAVPAAPVNLFYGGGLGRIVGTTKIKGSPNIPVRRRVRLIREIDGVCLAERWSDPVTGAYEFKGYDPAMPHTVIVYDGPRVFRAAVQDAVTPEAYTP